MQFNNNSKRFCIMWRIQSTHWYLFSSTSEEKMTCPQSQELIIQFTIHEVSAQRYCNKLPYGSRSRISILQKLQQYLSLLSKRRRQTKTSTFLNREKMKKLPAMLQLPHVEKYIRRHIKFYNQLTKLLNPLLSPISPQTYPFR